MVFASLLLLISYILNMIPLVSSLTIEEWNHLWTLFPKVSVFAIIYFLWSSLPSAMVVKNGLFQNFSSGLTFIVEWVNLEWHNLVTRDRLTKFTKHDRDSASTEETSRHIGRMTHVKDIVDYWGYGFEEHTVVTSDGFHLGIHRILPRSNALLSDATNKHREVVLLWHGLLTCSDLWVSHPAGRHTNLAFVLCDLGYDVWLGNNRGNKYSQKHSKYRPNQREFWNFCLDEFSLIDLPESVDYVLTKSHKSSLSYVGFSQGTAQCFAALAKIPELHNKIHLFVAMSPAMRPVLQSLKVPLWDIANYLSPLCLYLLLGRRYFLIGAENAQKYLPTMIHLPIINQVFARLFGWHTNKWSDVYKYSLFYHMYSPSSVKTIVHWFQISLAGKFQSFKDVSAAAESPSAYKFLPFDVDVPPTLIALFHGTQDTLLDIDFVKQEVPATCVVSDFSVEGYQHMDLLWADDAHTTVWPNIIHVLKKYGPNNRLRKIIHDPGMLLLVSNKVCLHSHDKSNSELPSTIL